MRQRQCFGVVETQRLRIHQRELLLCERSRIRRRRRLAADEDPVHTERQLSECLSQRSVQRRIGRQLLVVVEHQYPRRRELRQIQPHPAPQPAGQIAQIVGAEGGQFERRFSGAREQRVERLYEGRRIGIAGIDL